MNSETWHGIRELLGSSLDLSKEERAAFLADSSARPTVLREVRSLLKQEERFAVIDRPVGREDNLIGRRIDGYRICETLGRGGMGDVYLAEREDDYSQRVALKLVRSTLSYEEIIRRFRNERQILANLDHRYIARLIDGGTLDDKRPYLVMEYVEGEPIDTYCERLDLGIHDRLKLFCKVCAAVELSHHQLIIHRDIKPQNILVTHEGVPKLLDFGIAKILRPGLSASTVETAQGQGPMTFEYASPEHASGSHVQPSSDVYSLGVLLYRLLTNHLPYSLEGLSITQKVDRIHKIEPQRPSLAVLQPNSGVEPSTVELARARRTARELRGDLDSIVLKALQKKAQLRYATADQFAKDIERYLGKLPVAAREGTWPYRAYKFIDRNRVPLMIAAMFVMLVVSFGVSAVLLAQRAWEAEEVAQQARLEAIRLRLEAVRAQVRAEAEKVRAEAEKERAERVSQALENLFKDSHPDRVLGQPMSARDLLDRGLDRLSRDLEEEPQVLASLAGTLGRVLQALGDYEEAERMLRQSVELWRGEGVAAESDLALSLSDLGTLQYDLGKTAQAEAGLREAVASGQDLGERDVLVLSNLASILASRGAYDEARVLYEEVITRRLQRHGADHRDVSSSRHALGVLEFVTRNDEAAEEQLREALRIREIEFPKGSTKQNNVVFSLGMVRFVRGDLEGGEALVHRALGSQRRVLGDDHQTVAIMELNLAKILLARDEGPAAEAMVRRALEVLHKTRPEDDWRLADGRSVLGECLLRRGQVQEAASLLEESFKVLEGSRGPGTIYTHQACLRLHELYDSQGKAGARPLREPCGGAIRKKEASPVREDLQMTEPQPTSNGSGGAHHVLIPSRPFHSHEGQPLAVEVVEVAVQKTWPRRTATTARRSWCVKTNTSKLSAKRWIDSPFTRSSTVDRAEQSWLSP